MFDESSDIVISYIGREEGPYIQLVSNSKMDQTAIQAAMIDICLNPRTIWRNLSRTYYHFHPIFSGLDLAEIVHGMVGYYAVDPKSTTETLEGERRILFFLFEPGSDPVDALTSVEQAEFGAVPPALPAAILAAHHAFENGYNAIAGGPAVFASIANTWPIKGISKRSPHEIEALVHQTIDTNSTTNRALEQIVPTATVDRAKYLLVLAQAAWEPDVRQQLGKTHYQTAHERDILSQIASAWLYLQMDPAFKAGHQRIPVSHGSNPSTLFWRQALEWDAHSVPDWVMNSLCPKFGGLLSADILTMNRRPSEAVLSLASNLLSHLKQALPALSLPETPIRVILPDGAPIAPARNYIWTIYQTAKQELWVVIENNKHEKLSFCWSPPDAFKLNGWLPGRLERTDRSYWNVLLYALWYDLAAKGEQAFPPANTDAVRHWGTEAQQRRAIAWAAQVAPGAMERIRKNGGDSSLADDLLRSIRQTPDIQDAVGLACYSLVDFVMMTNS